MNTNRLDKRDTGEQTTKVIARDGECYELLNTLDRKTSEALFRQTGLDLQGKVILGEGSMGRVRLARHPAKGFLAVKKLDPFLYGNGDPNCSAIRTAERQIALSDKLKDWPWIMKSHTFSECQKKNGRSSVYIFQQLIVGQTMDCPNLMTEYVYNPDKMKNHFYQIIRSLSYMQQKGIFQVDSHLGNFMEDKSGNIILIDTSSFEKVDGLYTYEKWTSINILSEKIFNFLNDGNTVQANINGIPAKFPMCFNEIQDNAPHIDPASIAGRNPQEVAARLLIEESFEKALRLPYFDGVRETEG